MRRETQRRLFFLAIVGIVATGWVVALQAMLYAVAKVESNLREDAESEAGGAPSAQVQTSIANVDAVWHSVAGCH